MRHKILWLFCVGLLIPALVHAQVLSPNLKSPPSGGPSPLADYQLFTGAPPLSFTYNFSGSFEPSSPLNCSVHFMNASNGVLMSVGNQSVFDLNNPPPIFLPASFQILPPPHQNITYLWSVQCSNQSLSNSSVNRTIIVRIADKVFNDSLVGSDGVVFQFSSGPPTPLGEDLSDKGAGIRNTTNLSMMAIREAPNSAFFQLMVAVAGDRVGSALARKQQPDFQAPVNAFDGLNRAPFCSGNATITPRTDMQYYVYIDYDGNRGSGCTVNNTEINSSGYDFQVFFNASESGSVPKFRNCTVQGANFSSDANFRQLTGIVDVDYQASCVNAGLPHFRLITTSLLSQTGLSKANASAGFGFIAEIGNGSGIQDSFNQRFKYTPGTLDFIPFEPRLCVNTTDPTKKNETYAAGHSECSAFGGCVGGNCDQVPGQGFLPPSSFDNCFANGPVSSAICLSTPSCAYLPQCRGIANDTSSPSVLSTEAVAFGDRAFIDWSSNEPSNGSVAFYNQDSTCASLNATVPESFPPPPPGVSFMQDFRYKPFHHVELSSTSLGFSLLTGTYYYKTTSCDKSANCAVSNCLSLTTSSANSFTSPKLINFTQPSGVSFQIDSGTGGFSDFGAGFQSGGTGFRMKFGSPNGTWSIVLVGVDFTSNLSINFTNAFAISESQSLPLVGINSTTWLEIAQKLGADSVELTIPGNGNALIKCDEDGTDCTDVTGLASIISQTKGSTTWSIPVSLGFSAYSVNSSGGFTLVADKGVYGIYPRYLSGFVNLTNDNASVAGVYNVTVDISQTLAPVVFSLAINGSDGVWTSPAAQSGNVFNFTNVRFASGSIHQFRFNASSPWAGSGVWNFTVRLSVGSDYNTTLAPANPFYVGSINSTLATNQTFNASSIQVNYSFVSEKDAAQLCALKVDGIVVQTNSSVPNGTLASFTLTSLLNASKNLTIECVDDVEPAENLTSALMEINFADNTAPIVHLQSPLNGSTQPDALVGLALLINESNPASTLCSYFVRNGSNVTLVNATLPLSAFSQIQNSSWNLTTTVAYNLTNGLYNLTMNCSDQTGRSNLTESIFRVTDTLAPRVSGNAANAGSSSVTITWTTHEAANETVNISAGIGYGTDGNSDSFGLSHSIQVTGLTGSTTYGYTIRSCDQMGNCNTSVFSSFTTSAGSSSSSSGGSSGGGGSSSPSSAASTVVVRSWSTINGSSVATVTPASSAIAFSEVSFKVKSQVNNAQMTISSLGTGKPSGLPTPPGYVVSQYVDVVTSSLPAAVLENITIKFALDRSWLMSNAVPDDGVFLLHYENGVWKALPTSLTSSNSVSAFYTASTPSFSYFAVAGRASAASPAPAPSPPPAAAAPSAAPSAAPTEEQPAPPPAPAIKTGGSSDSKTGIILWVVAGLVVVGLIGGYFFMNKKPAGPKL